MDRSGSVAPSAAGGPSCPSSSYSCSCRSSGPPPASPHTGTTIVAVAFDGGVVIGADSRVSTGTYVSNRAADKIHPLSDNAWLLRSGSAADTQAVGDYVRHFLSQLESELGGDAPVRAAAQLVARINYNNKASLLGAMIVAGYDKKSREGQVYGVPIGGTLVKQEWATDGSGSTYIWGYLDDAWRPGLDRQGAEKLVVTSLALAMSIDGSSGGMARLVTITESGAERRIVRGDEVPQFWDALEAPGKALGGNEDSFVVV